jgi:hypothetical protein
MDQSSLVLPIRVENQAFLLVRRRPRTDPNRRGFVLQRSLQTGQGQGMRERLLAMVRTEIFMSSWRGGMGISFFLSAFEYVARGTTAFFFATELFTCSFLQMFIILWRARVFSSSPRKCVSELQCNFLHNAAS